MYPMLKSTTIATNEELTLFPRYNTTSSQSGGPISTPSSRPRSAIVKSRNPKNPTTTRKSLQPKQSQSASKIRVTTSPSPLLDAVSTNETITSTGNSSKFHDKPRNKTAGTTKNESSEVAVAASTEPHLEMIHMAKPKHKPNESVKSQRKIDPPKNKLIIPPNASEYAKNAASTVGISTATSMKTQIVLAPRFQADNFVATQSKLCAKESPPGTNQREVWSRPSESLTRSKIQQNDDDDQDSSSRIMVRMPEGMFPPEKARWVQLALEKLATNGTITRKQMNTPAFQRKIGILFDQSVGRRSFKVGSQVNKIVHQQSGRGSVSKKVPPQTPTTSPVRSSKRTSASSKKTTPHSEKNLTPRTLTPRSPRYVSGQPADEKPPLEVQKKVSDILLHMLLKGMMVENGITKSVDAHQDEITADFMTPEKKKSISTNTENDDDDIDDWAWMMSRETSKLKRGKSTNGNISDLTTPWISRSNVDPIQDIKNCFIFQGKVCPMEASQKPINTFAPLSESRR